MTAAIARAAERIRRSELPLLLVTHGGAIRAALAHAGHEVPPITNTAVWKVAWEGRVVAAEAL